MTMEVPWIKQIILSLTLVVIVLIIPIASIEAESKTRSFGINYERNTFTKDGQDFRYISGSFHYFRSVREHWDDILRKFRLAGLNAVQTYVEWASHQPNPTEDYNFDGHLNLFEFIETAQKNNLLVILRPGPFIDAERDMGGLPAWLLWQKTNMRLRTSDLEYVYFVSRWFDYLLPKLKPYLYENGGNIIMIQVENEYGSFGCDKNYTGFLRDLIRLHLGDEVVLFTTDGAVDSMVKCGFVEDVYPTVDFGAENLAGVNESFAIQRHFAPRGPLVNSEFYPGWLDHWQKPHNTQEPSVVADGIDSILSTGANLNIYMFYGGTSFGFRAGSNVDSGMFDPCPTSYDYDAPLNEAGDPTEKYFAIKDVISKYLPVPSEDPRVNKKGKYGKVPLQAFSVLHDTKFLRSISSNPVESRFPLSFEDLKTSSGFVLYETTIDFMTSDPVLLTAKGLKDRAYVYADRTYVGTLARTEQIVSMPIYVKKGTALTILVENQGRPCYGSQVGENKGLGNVTLGNTVLEHWKMYRLGELNSNTLKRFAERRFQNPNYRNKTSKPRSSSTGTGTFYYGNFTLENSNASQIYDTFVRFDGWTKGQIWVNGFNLGRYWPAVGPQETLYLPGPLLKVAPETNIFMIFELESAPEDCRPTALHSVGEDANNCFISLTDTHVINGDTPYQKDPVDVESKLRLNWV